MKFIYICVFTALWGACVYDLVFGSVGLLCERRRIHEELILRDGIAARSRAVRERTDELVAWQSSDFWAEKMGREQLLLARPDEFVYFFHGA